MLIAIPSRSRSARQRTAGYLREAGLHGQTVIFVPKGQFLEYTTKNHDFEILECPDSGIARTRQFIGLEAARRGHKKFLMLDDDLHFYTRVSRADWHLRYSTPEQVRDAVSWVENALDSYAHAGISAREGNNRLKDDPVLATRPLRALAYRTEDFNSLEHGRVDIMEDFDVTLQLLYRGQPNAVSSFYAQAQTQTQDTGGCSDYRTHEVHAASVKKMAELHPGIVRLREKKNKSGGEFGSRLEATIYWKKALGKN